MPVFDSLERQKVYVVLGIDEHEHDQVLAVCSCYKGAKKWLTETVITTKYYDLWIEKHAIL